MDTTEQLLNATASALQTLFEGMGFALLIFDFHEPGLSNYTSNANRKDMIQALRETADRLEKNEDMPMTIGEA